MTTPRVQLADELLRSFTATLRSSQLYSKGHPIIARNLNALSAAIQLLHSLEPSIVIGLIGNEVIVDDTPVAKAETMGPLVLRLRQNGIERITIERGVTLDELALFVEATTALEHGDGAGTPETSAFSALPHIRVGRVLVDQQADADMADMATLRRMYGEAVSAAGDVWDSAQTEGKPDATVARTMIDGLAQAVAQNRTALLALTTLKNYDNYTFTHMVNVSILTMGQARARHRWSAPAGVRPGGADARHRQGAHAARGAEQAGQADRRRVRHHEAARGRGRRDPSRHARYSRARARGGLRAPPAARRIRATPTA